MIDTVIKGGTVVTPAGVGDWEIGLGRSWFPAGSKPTPTKASG